MSILLIPLYAIIEDGTMEKEELGEARMQRQWGQVSVSRERA